MKLPAIVLLPLALMATMLVTAGPATAAALPTTLSLTGPTSVKAGQPTVLSATLREQASGRPLANAPVQLRRNGGVVGTVYTGADGVVRMQPYSPAGTMSYVATFPGTATHATSQSAPHSVTGQVFSSSLTISGPRTVTDETSVILTVTWRAADGSPISGPIKLQRRIGAGGTWTVVPGARTDANGVYRVRTGPRDDSRWYAVGAAGSWWRAGYSNWFDLDNRPPAAPVVFPSGTPQPTYIPPQARAVGAGASTSISAIPTSVWNSMRGRSWHRGCPVGRASLRLVRTNYWGFDGYRYRGEMVVNAAIAAKTAGALSDMYTRHLPLRRMYRVDRFGWSSRVNGADDHASMRADNSSAFNCRWVVNRRGVMSPHATGRAIDLNTWENPYRSATGWVPNSWWATRSHPRVAWRSSSHPVIQVWRNRGFRWSYGANDSQHWDGRGVPPTAGTFVG